MTILNEFLRFASVAVVGMTVHFTVLVTLVEFAGARALAASAIGFLLGAICNYFLNYHITFKSSKQHRDAMPKFLTVAVSGLALNTVVMTVTLETAQWSYQSAQIVAIVFVLVSNFTFNRVWTFRHQR